MSRLQELISRYSESVVEASSLSDHEAVLNLLAEYRKAVEELKDCSEDIREELSAMADQSRQARFDLLLIAAATHPSQTYVDSLCKILALEDPTLPNEQIVDLLFKIPSAKSVPYLKKACLLKLPHDMYDEFGVKCLDALAAINTSEAWTAIEAALSSPSVRIRERTQELISWRTK